MDKAPSQPQTYVMPAPWGSVRLVTEDGQLTAVRPSLEKVSSPSPAPEAVAEVMGLLEEVIATPRATGVETRRPFPILIGCHRVCGASEKEAFDILHPESFKPQAYLGCETLSPVAQWLRLADLSL